MSIFRRLYQITETDTSWWVDCHRTQIPNYLKCFAIRNLFECCMDIYSVLDNSAQLNDILHLAPAPAARRQLLHANAADGTDLPLSIDVYPDYNHASIQQLYLARRTSNQQGTQTRKITITSHSNMPPPVLYEYWTYDNYPVEQHQHTGSLATRDIKLPNNYYPEPTPGLHDYDGKASMPIGNDRYRDQTRTPSANYNYQLHSNQKRSAPPAYDSTSMAYDAMVPNEKVVVEHHSKLVSFGNNRTTNGITNSNGGGIIANRLNSLTAGNTLFSSNFSNQVIIPYNERKCQFKLVFKRRLNIYIYSERTQNSIDNWIVEHAVQLRSPLPPDIALLADVPEMPSLPLVPMFPPLIGWLLSFR